MCFPPILLLLTGDFQLPPFAVCQKGQGVSEDPGRAPLSVPGTARPLQRQCRCRSPLGSAGEAKVARLAAEVHRPRKFPDPPSRPNQTNKQINSGSNQLPAPSSPSSERCHRCSGHQRLAGQSAPLSLQQPRCHCLCASLFAGHTHPCQGPVARLILGSFWRNIWISGDAASASRGAESWDGRSRGHSWLALHRPCPPSTQRNPLDSPKVPASPSGPIASSSQGFF